MFRYSPSTLKSQTAVSEHCSELIGCPISILLLIWSVASAQEPKGWLGADVIDVTKTEADKLGWDAPHSAKVGVVASDSPADKAGLKTGDIIVSLDNVELETAADFEKAISAKSPGNQVRLRVLSEGRKRRVVKTLATKPKVQAQ